MRIFSSGGGTQSTAALVLSVQGVIDYPIHIFANVGNNAEDPATIDYINDYIKPYAESNGIQWVEVCKKRDGKVVDLYDFAMAAERSIPIPVRMSRSGAPGSRTCTQDWKIVPISNWVKAQIPMDVIKKANRAGRLVNKIGLVLTEEESKLAAFKAKEAVHNAEFPIILAKGISTDEAHRARTNSGFHFYRSAYPLIDLNLSRIDCIELVKKAGLPEPPKSSCWFCPFKTFDRWQTMRREKPQLFSKAVAMEKTLSDRAESLGRSKTYFTSRGTTRSAPLDEVTSDQLSLLESLDLDFCESGFCMT